MPKPFTPSLLLNIITHALLDPEGGPRPEPEQAAPATPSVPEAWRGKRILLVEDNELNQEVALGLLAELGFTVELATDGAAALDKVLGNAADYYAAVLMDMQMPVMDGLTATRAIRRTAGYASLPIIAMTANAMVEDRARCLAAGMNDHVAKPIEPDLLRAVLVRWVGGDAPESTGSEPASAMAAEFPVLAGLDTVAGLRRMMGNAASYAALLRKFAEHYEGAAREIAGAVDSGDPETAERLAHTLKGVAGNIGAERLAALAATVEDAVHAGATAGDFNGRLAALGDALAALIADIRQRLLPSPLSPATVPASRHRVDAGQTSKRLADLLADSDVAAIAFLTENSAVLRDILGKHFREIETATEGFDFAAALGALRRAASDREIAL